MTNYGELMPLGGGDPIPLLKPMLVVGRRESTDIVLRFPNVSGQHCELTIVDGYWVVKDLGSSNGTKVNGSRVTEQRLEPGDTLSIAKHEFEIAYEPVRLGATVAPPEEASKAGLFTRSLLEAAGLESRRPAERRPSGDRPRR
ncbi:MAG: hypothetical protein RLZZ21_115 [Planctomycetota bacterium]|jgi:predicted component of type VI protein secretion system